MASSQHRSAKPPDTRPEPARAPLDGALRWIDGQDLHPRLQDLLLRVQAAERTAVGAHRRPTFRLMRELLGASMRLGVPTQLLAECLGSSRDSVRNRASGRDGTISAELIKELTGLTPAQLDHLSGGELTRHAQQADGRGYATPDVVRALLSTPRQPRRARLAHPSPPAPGRAPAIRDEVRGGSRG